MSEDLSWMQKPPAFLDPEQAKASTELLRRPSNIPRGHVDATETRAAHREDLTPSPTALSPDFVWFFPGLAYCMIGLDRSLFDLYTAAVNTSITIRTHRADKPIFAFRGVDVAANPWFATVQGVTPDVAEDFMGFASSFEFRSAKGPQPTSWFVEPVRTRIADPFVHTPTGIDIVILLPGCLTTKRAVVIAEPAGLRLGTPVLSIKAAGHVPTNP